ncbi:cytochrome c biogenesis CcdA family protein [Natranaerobius trueperi]|nr:cytochrome c biogenesis protein CcdA [Natranaerobius trueperi]
MVGDSVSISVAFLAGFLFFFSPCVWPLYPAYISYITGTSFSEMKQDRPQSGLLINALGFVLGFTIIFVLLGATATTIGQLLNRPATQDIIRVVAGGLVIFFGLQLGGFLKLPMLNRTYKMNFIPKKPGFFSSTLFGSTFAFAWTPCATAILGSILMLAGSSKTVYQGMGLLGTFSLGFSIPFLLLAFFLKQLYPKLNRCNKYLPKINFVSGGILILVGLLILFDKFADISLWLFNLVN